MHNRESKISTGRKRSSRRRDSTLKLDDRRFRHIVETIRDIVFVTDSKGNFLYMNPAGFSILGYTPKEIYSMNYTEIFPPEYKDTGFGIYSNQSSSGTEFTYHEIPILRKDHSLLWFGQNVIRVEDGGHIYFYGLARDITDRLKVKEELKDSEEKYRTMAENSTDIIWILDITTLRFTYISPSVEKVRGLTPEEAVNEKLEDLFPSEDLVKVLNIMATELEKDKSGLYDPDRRITFEVRQFNRNRQPVWVEITGKFIRNKEGDAIAAQGSTRDITHRKLVEFERDRFAENLSAARMVQQEILPQRPPDSELFDISYRYMPMEAVGGDYFTFVEFREHNNFGIFIGDVSGHGVPAALYTMMLKAVTDRLFRKYNLDTSRFMEELNKEVSLSIHSHFITGIFGLLSKGNGPDTISFTFSKGGHPYPVHFRKNGNCGVYVETPGRALGFISDQKYGSESIELQYGDRLYLYTDGLPEAINQNRELYGFERFLRSIDDAGRMGLTLDESLDYILKKMVEFSSHIHQEDDIVIIGVEAKGD